MTVLLANGKVFVAGGFTGHVVSATAQLYDPATSSWSSAGTMATPRYVATATILGDGRVLIAGGIASGSFSTAEFYTP